MPGDFTGFGFTGEAILGEALSNIPSTMFFLFSGINHIVTEHHKTYQSFLADSHIGSNT